MHCESQIFLRLVEIFDYQIKKQNFDKNASFFDKTAILSVNKKLKRKISNKIQINMHKQI